MPDFKTVIKSQYHASLATLRQAIDRCPELLWLQIGPQPVACWQIAYHTLFFTDLYLQIKEKHFKPRVYHQHTFIDLDQAAKRQGKLPAGLEPYTIEQMREYWQIVDDRVDACVDAMNLDSTDCGFPWYSVGKLEHQFINIRHVQHHAAQLADRLRVGANVGVDWVAAGDNF